MEGQREPPGTDSGAAGEWCSVAEAARRVGVSEKAVRERIKHGSVEWRPRGNTGREVLVTPEMERDGASPEPPGIDPEVAALRVEVARFEERLASREREAAILREALEASREETGRADARADRLVAELAEARRPALLRLLETLRRR